MSDYAGTTLDSGRTEPPEVLEHPELLNRNLWVGVRLWVASQAFFFVAFLFSFFYLRALKENHMWHPAGVKPPFDLGTAILACVVVSALLFAAAIPLLRRNVDALGWLVLVILAWLLGLAAISLQCYQWIVMRFGPTQGSYASVFVAWTGFYVAIFFGVALWVETLIAQSLRARFGLVRGPRSRGGAHPSGRRPVGTIATIPTSFEPQGLAAHRGAGIEALFVYWSFLAVVEIGAYILLYIVE